MLFITQFLIFCERFRDIIILLAPYPLPSDRVGQLTAGKTFSAVSLRQVSQTVVLVTLFTVCDFNWWKLDEMDTIEANKFEEYVKNLLECPVCMEPIQSAPIHQCTNGHVLCKDCIAKLESCPICRNDSNTARNLIFEQIIGNFIANQEHLSQTIDLMKSPVFN